MTTILARFRTHELAMRAHYTLFPMIFYISMPRLDQDGGSYPWTLDIAYTPTQQPLVLATVGRYGGVTFQEEEHGEGGVPAADLS